MGQLRSFFKILNVISDNCNYQC